MKHSQKIIIVIATAVFILLLKWQFMEPGLEAWLWLLKPAVVVFRIFTNTPLVYDVDAGFVSQQLGFVIDKSCSGLNFLLILMSVSTFLIVTESKKNSLPLWLASLAACYPALVIINGMRLVFVYYVFLWAGPSSLLHMIFSILIFIFFLFLYTRIILTVLKGNKDAPNSAN